MLTINGAAGEGGGQILRTALSLSVLQQRPIRIENIRAGRPKPGLMRQHLTCVKAAAQISAADVQGDMLGSTALEFHPRALAPGHHHFAIGTAGSAMLVLQTVLPPLLRAEEPSRITIEGGTHNPLAPSATFFEHAFLPRIREMGARVTFACERVGLFPAGGGRVVLNVQPSELTPLTLTDRGERIVTHAEVLIAGIAGHVALRELTRIADRFRLRREQLRHTDLGHSTGPGNVISVIAQFQRVTEVITAFGARGVSAESVADGACAELESYLASSAPVGEHLSDQLLLPLWLAGGGEFRTDAISGHLETNAALINQFDGPQVALENGSNGVRISLRDR